MSAFWIRSNGETYNVPINHINNIIEDPFLFGISKTHIEDVYKKHDERMGQEGNAREEIILEVIKKGWIRVRKYKNVGWSFNVYTLSNRTKDLIFDWTDKILNSGILGELEKDKYNQMKIISTRDNKEQSISLMDVLNGKLYEGKEKFLFRYFITEGNKNSKIKSMFNELLTRKGNPQDD